MLRRWNTGEREALAQLVSLTYRDLHAIAAGYLRHENRGHTLQATGLVSELYIRLTRQREVPVSGRRHFYTFAAMVMRGFSAITPDKPTRSSAPEAPRFVFLSTRTWPGLTPPVKIC